MLLGLSSATSEDPAAGQLDIAAVAGSEHGDGGVAHGAVLTRFAEAVHTEVDLAAARAAVVEAVGEAGLVDSAAICANFNMMVRIADGTGTPLDPGSLDPSADLRRDLGLDELESRRLVDAP